MQHQTVLRRRQRDTLQDCLSRPQSTFLFLKSDEPASITSSLALSPQAFLVVLGTNGLFVDGCPVFPSAPASASPVTVPLPNNSTIEIHKKRFQFCYPPKELRAALLATPSKDPGNGSDLSTPERARRKRALRMSMIQSAQVFTPRPSTNAQENLRILKTPIKNPFPTPQRARRVSSPLKRGPAIVEEDEREEDEEEMEEDIVLVETNHPSVVEEDRDLVILERVVVKDPPPAPPTPQRQVQFPFVAPSPQRQAAPPQTPRRRPPRASLHRAVLIRSAQRAAMRREMEREEEEEEVEEVVVAARAGEGHVDMAMDDVREEEEEEEEGEDAGEHEDQTPGPLSSLRKSLTAVRNAWPFKSSSVPQEGETRDNEPTEDDEEQDITEVRDAPLDSSCLGLSLLVHLLHRLMTLTTNTSKTKASPWTRILPTKTKTKTRTPALTLQETTPPHLRSPSRRASPIARRPSDDS